MLSCPFRLLVVHTKNIPMHKNNSLIYKPNELTLISTYVKVQSCKKLLMILLTVNYDSDSDYSKFMSR